MNKTQTRKKKKWPWVLGVIILIAAAVVIFLPSLSPVVAAVNTVGITVTKGNIAQTVVGTGSLNEVAGDEVEIKVPEGIRIDEIYFESGDEVKNGDVLATIDSLSLQQRITEIQNEINDLDTSIHLNKDDANDREEIIRAGINGRVKKIYIEKSDVISSVMDRHGMLMLISIDGKMAVDFTTTTELSIGDTVTVAFENGRRRTGTVEHVGDIMYTVTLTDNGPELDDFVEIEDNEGNTIGSGT